MKLLPDSLSRKAIKQAFPRVSEATWDNLFDYEKENGLYKMRVPGPTKYAFYDVKLLMQWLVMNGRYRLSDFYEYGEVFYERPVLSVRRHALV